MHGMNSATLNWRVNPINHRFQLEREAFCSSSLHNSVTLIEACHATLNQSSSALLSGHRERVRVDMRPVDGVDSIDDDDVVGQRDR